MDTKQTCRGFKFRKQGLGGNRERIEWRYTRALDTCDARDYKIEEGTTHVVWTLGRGPVSRLSGLNVSDEASVRWGMVRTRLLTVTSPELGPDTRTWRVLSDNVSLPTVDTFYACSVHKLPTQLRRKHHVVRYEADIQKGNEDVVHHMEVFHCPPASEPLPLWSGSCDDPEAPPQLAQCKKVLAAWAIGAGPFTYPPEAGLAIGGSEINQYVMLEVHYNNPKLRSGIVDASGKHKYHLEKSFLKGKLIIGVKFHMTLKLRKYDAGIMELGLIYNNWMAIPPRMSSFTLTGVCVSECTGAGLPEPGVTVFGSQLHTHGSGRAVETSVVRRDSGVEELVNRDPHYSTHFQEIRTLERSVQVRPGDALVTRCSYDTRDRGNITLGGFGFTEEMCVNYIHYYPRQDLEICKSSVSKKELENYFQRLAHNEDQKTSDDYSVEQNYRSVHWSPRRSLELGLVYDSGEVKMQCQTGTGASLPGNWESIGQPIVRRPMAVPDACTEPPMDNKDLLDLEENEDNMDKMKDSAREKKFSLNSFESEWDDYDSWGVDKRAVMTHRGSILGWDRSMDHSHNNHTGKRGQNQRAYAKRFQENQPYLRLSRKLGSM